MLPGCVRRRGIGGLLVIRCDSPRWRHRAHCRPGAGTSTPAVVDGHRVATAHRSFQRMEAASPQRAQWVRRAGEPIPAAASHRLLLHRDGPPRRAGRAPPRRRIPDGVLPLRIVRRTDWGPVRGTHRAAGLRFRPGISAEPSAGRSAATKSEKRAASTQRLTATGSDTPRCTREVCSATCTIRAQISCQSAGES